MYLKSLELQGFKSFPDKTVLKFGQGITGVVGPNGSGKSNISDAVRWVLGEQSSKSLRGNKMEDVIFSGTRSRAALSSAKVSLILDNKDHLLPIDSDEVVITRRYYRSGESEYLINQQNVRLRDVHELLMDTGLGREGYAIIGQGKIAEIISARSDDRRKIFEEAAGISKFRYRKEDAQKRLNAAEENLVRLRDILMELESRVGPLKSQSKKAYRFLDLAQRKKEIEIVIWDDTLRKSKDIVSDFEKKIYIISNDIEKISAAVGDREVQIDLIFQKRQAATVEVDERIREKQKQFDDISEIRSKIAVLYNEIQHAKESITQMEQLSGETQDSRQEIEQSISVKELSLTGLETERLQLVEQAEQVQQELLSRKGDEEGYSTRIDELTDRIGEKSKTVSDYKVSSFSGKSAIEEITSSVKSIDVRIQAMQESFDRQEELVSSTELDLHKAKEEITSLHNTIEGVEMIAQLKKDKMDKVQGSLQSIQQSQQEMQQKLRLLRDLENSMEGFSHSVKVLIQQGKANKIHGIHGVVSKLIQVDQKHAIAIETALGASMQHIVVASEDSAKKCMAYLKETKSGRATFLPLSAVRGRQKIQEQLDSFDGFVGIGSDLVTCDNTYREILNNLLARTAVVETIDDAVFMARKFSYRFRIVTLDGQVVNAGGSMTGGSLVRNAGILGRSGQIEALLKNCESKQVECVTLEDELRRRKEEYESARAQQEGVQAELQTANEDETKLTIVLASAKSSFEEARSSLDRAKNEKNEATQRLIQLQTSVTQSDTAYKEAQQEVEVLSMKLQQLTGRSRQASQDVNDKSETLSDRRIAAMGKEKEVEAVRNEIRLLMEQRERTFLQDETVAARMQATAVTIEKLESDAATLAQTEGEKQSRIEKIEEEIRQISQQRDEAEQQTVEIRASIKDEMEERERLSGSLARLQERKVSAETEYDTITANLWEEYEMTRGEAAQEAQKIGHIPNAKQELTSTRSQIRGLGHVNVGAIEEYKEVSERYGFMKTQTDDVEESKKKLLGLVSDLTHEMRKAFVTSFEAINKNFSRIFVELFGGGSARLGLADPDNVLDSGIDIFVEPPGKIIRNLASLSGGEQSFVAISIYFAILAVRPSPFCVLDEIEAALDDVNVYKYASYLRKINKKTQFITITHRRGTMEEADVLYGVTMQDDGISKLLQLNVEEIEEKLGIQNK